MGIQRDEFGLCAGYSELELPKDNLTDIPKGSSRKNGKEEELVPADDNIKTTAAREVKEELNIDIDEASLISLGDWSKTNVTSTQPILAMPLSCLTLSISIM